MDTSRLPFSAGVGSLFSSDSAVWFTFCRDISLESEVNKLATYLRLFPKPYIHVPDGYVDYKVFHVDPRLEADEVIEKIETADWEEQIVLNVVLPDLVFPVPMGFRKCDWSAWMVHELEDLEEEVQELAPGNDVPPNSEH